MHVIYVIGPPGAGKTTLVNGALHLLGREPATFTQPIPHVRYGDVWMLGKQREQFGGTDALSMSIQPKVIEWLHTMTQPHQDRPRVLIGEGDRLANNSFFNAVHTCGYKLTIIHLDLDAPQARARALARGTEQSATWWKGRYTKVNNLVNSRRVATYDATAPQHRLAANLAKALDRQPGEPHRAIR